VKAFVRTQPEADEQARVIEQWWRENRLGSPDLFTNELAAAFRLLSNAPGAGRRYSARSIPGLRRVMLPNTRYHVYYVFDAEHDEVNVLAIWSASRGKGPPLRRP
jgi:plasmid stabilization system protein ParE